LRLNSYDALSRLSILNRYRRIVVVKAKKPASQPVTVGLGHCSQEDCCDSGETSACPDRCQVSDPNRMIAAYRRASKRADLLRFFRGTRMSVAEGRLRWPCRGCRSLRVSMMFRGFIGFGQGAGRGDLSEGTMAQCISIQPRAATPTEFDAAQLGIVGKACSWVKSRQRITAPGPAIFRNRSTAYAGASLSSMMSAGLAGQAVPGFHRKARLPGPLVSLGRDAQPRSFVPSPERHRSRNSQLA